MADTEDKRPSSKKRRVLVTADESQIPTQGSKGAAGYDLFSNVDIEVPAEGKAMIATGIQLEIPMGVYGHVMPRSGLAVKHHLGVGAGVIDSDYRGVVSVVLFNHGKEAFGVKKGDRIAQMIFKDYVKVDFVRQSELSETVRGEAGFGSTGQ